VKDLYLFSHSNDGIMVLVTSIMFSNALVTYCPRVRPVGGISDTISSRVLWWLRRHFGQDLAGGL